MHKKPIYLLPVYEVSMAVKKTSLSGILFFHYEQNPEKIFSR